MECNDEQEGYTKLRICYKNNLMSTNFYLRLTIIYETYLLNLPFCSVCQIKISLFGCFHETFLIFHLVLTTYKNHQTQLI